MKRIIDYPHFVKESFYQESLERMCRRLEQNGAAIAIYQVGGVSSPGISDLDMVAVMKNEFSFTGNILEGLTGEERYLFIHNLYGISETDFRETEPFVFYHHFRLLSGKELRQHVPFSESDREILSTQVAMEFLSKMYVNLFLQQEYGVLRMRDLLLHVKAMTYDLDFLKITDEGLKGCVNQVLEWRKSWFLQKPGQKEILKWWEKLYASFVTVLHDTMKSAAFYLPPQDKYKLAKNIYLHPVKEKAGASRDGILLPAFFSLAGKKYFRLQNRLNRFRFEFPVTTEDIPDVIRNKFELEKRLVSYNKKFLPHFLPLTSSLHAI